MRRYWKYFGLVIATLLFGSVGTLAQVSVGTRVQALEYRQHGACRNGFRL